MPGIKRTSAASLVPLLVFVACAANSQSVPVISEKVVAQVKAATVAIAIHPPISAGNIKLGELKVLGTGFVVAPGVVMSNRHVAEAVVAYIKKYSSVPMLLYTHGLTQPRQLSLSLGEGIEGIKLFPRPDKSTQGSWGYEHPTDFAFFLDTKGREDEDRQRNHPPLTFGDLSTLRVGIPLAVSGYLMGEALLYVPEVVPLRFGPVLHQGHISALSPWDADEPRGIATIVTDISAGPGLSGSPVVVSATGRVVGIHYAGNPNVGVGFAIPLDKQRVDDLLLKTFAEQNGITGDITMLTPLGDLTPPRRRELQAQLREKGIRVPSTVGSP